MAASGCFQACQAPFAARLHVQASEQSLKLSAFLPPPPFCSKLHAKRTTFGSLKGERHSTLTPIGKLSAHAEDERSGVQKIGPGIARRHLILGGAGILVATAVGEGGGAAVATATSSGVDNLVRPPAKVLVIGAGGATGGRIVRELLKRGYLVTAGVRDVEKAKAKLGPADGLSFVRADVTESESAIAESIGDAEAVIVATGKASLNPGDSWSVDNLGTQKAVDAARTKGVKKFVLISSILTNGAAIGQFFNPAYLVLNIIGGGVLFAKLKAEQHIKSAGVDFTIVRPGGLSKEPPKGNVVMGSEDTLYTGSISRDLVARVAVEALTSTQASNKIVEIVESPDAPSKSFDELFAACKNSS